MFQAEVQWTESWGRHIEKRLLDALFLTHRNLANFKAKVENKATVDVCGCVVLHLVHLVKRCAKYYIAYCVGFCVARSTLVGNARASMRGMSD